MLVILNVFIKPSIQIYLLIILYFVYFLLDNWYKKYITSRDYWTNERCIYCSMFDGDWFV
jgi:hypothetical protein